MQHSLGILPNPKRHSSEAQYRDEEAEQMLRFQHWTSSARPLASHSFERAILLLCAGMELDSSFAGLCATAHGDPTRPYPTFGLALATFDEPLWEALTPEAPLRRWRLIEITSQAGTLLTASPLRIDERILHFLTGIQYLDERLVGMIEPVPADSDLVPSHQSPCPEDWSCMDRCQMVPYRSFSSAAMMSRANAV